MNLYRIVSLFIFIVFFLTLCSNTNDGDEAQSESVISVVTEERCSCNKPLIQSPTCAGYIGTSTKCSTVETNCSGTYSDKGCPTLKMKGTCKKYKDTVAEMNSHYYYEPLTNEKSICVGEWID